MTIRSATNPADTLPPTGGSMTANDLALGRNWYTADAATLKTGSDWARWELHWADGAMVQGVEDTREDAIAALRRYGFYPTSKDAA